MSPLQKVQFVRFDKNPPSKTRTNQGFQKSIFAILGEKRLIGVDSIFTQIITSDFL